MRRIKPMAKPIVVNDSDFAEKVLQSSTPVVVDFWAPWCGPCRVIAPILDKLANEYEGRLTIAKVNTDDNVQYASQLGIQGIPTLVIFKNGKEVGRLIGARPEAMYREIFDKVLAMA
ncbi:MAG: thioredoxin [Chloroflexus sp.]